MSKHEFVVIQVWTKYNDSDDGRWLDYSRCSAAQARSYLTTDLRESGLWRAVHFIRSEEVLSDRQLRVMAEMVPSQWENRPPTGGDHWSVTVVWNTVMEPRTQERFVDSWTGPGWSDMIADIARESAETGDEVQSLKLH